MIALTLLLFSTFAHEVAASIGKKAVSRRQESLYALGFLGVFWMCVFMGVSVLFGGEFVLSTASLPTLLPRIILECGLAYLGAQAIIKADRSTDGFLRLLTIPLLLMVDIRLGYSITPLQIAGIGLLFVGMGFLLLKSKRSNKGAKYVLAFALLAVVTASLYKYNITHYNSVAAEQMVSGLAVMVFFSIMARIHRTTQPIFLIAKPLTGVQSLSAGVSFTLQSFAFLYAPPSLVITIKRGLTLLWTIIFGHKWFHEHKLAVKLRAASLAMIGLLLVSIT